MSELAKTIVKKWKNAVRPAGDDAKCMFFFFKVLLVVCHYIYIHPSIHPSVCLTPPSTPTSLSASKISAVKSESASAAPSPSNGRSPAPVQSPILSKSTPIPGSTAASSSNVVRTTKTDDVTIPSKGDKVRDKCSEMIYDALACDSGARTCSSFIVLISFVC